MENQFIKNAIKIIQKEEDLHNYYNLFASSIYAFSKHPGTLRKIEESFEYDVRFMHLMDNEAPSYAKIGEFINNLFVKFHHIIYSLLVNQFIKETGINVDDFDIHRFVTLFSEVLEENVFELVNHCFRYTRDYCHKNKNKITDVYSFFAYALKENIRKMDRYDEWMEKYYAELDAYFSSIRDNSEDE